MWYVIGFATCLVITMIITLIIPLIAYGIQTFKRFIFDDDEITSKVLDFYNDMSYKCFYSDYNTAVPIFLLIGGSLSVVWVVVPLIILSIILAFIIRKRLDIINKKFQYYEIKRYN